MEELINYIFQYGIGTLCVAYLIYDRMTTSKDIAKTMQEVVVTLIRMNERLDDIEKKVNKKN